MNRYATIYEKELYEEVLPFWEKYSIDTKGGYFTCLLADGTVFDQDKFIWLQARQVWTFAMLAIEIEDDVLKERWTNIAIHGAKFLESFGRDEKGDWYFSTNRNGEPLIQAYNIFSDCFACMAFAKLYGLTGKERYKTISLKTFERIEIRKKNPKGIYEKKIAKSRPLRGFSLPMIMSNLVLELGELVNENQSKGVIDECIETVMNDFYDAKEDLILENILENGESSDSFEGRILNPGHAIEAMWFMMDIAAQRKDHQLLLECKERMLAMLEKGWDREYGGVFYFLDRKGYPPQQLEWDQKLWWVHLETLVGLSKAIQLTGCSTSKKWFEKVHEYTWHHFRDVTQGGEWYGYLKRDGTRLLELKGGKWKGCFHVPRALFQISRALQ